MNRLLTVAMSTFLVLVALPDALAQADPWPRTLQLEQGTMTIYPLQVDSKTGDLVRYRAALAYRETADAEPVFGAGWFESAVEIDAARQIVHPKGLKVTQTRFPAGTSDLEAALAAALARESAGWDLDLTVGELQAALKQAEAESLAGQQLNTAPPKIYYRDHPALLVTMDGDPVLREIENSPYQAVINTPYPLIYDGRNYYLNAAKDVWYRAGQATGPYRFDASPPAAVAALVQPDEEAVEESGAETVTVANAPEIIVSTEPAELIVTEGPAAFVPLVDDLLVLQNSEDDVFMHVGSQQFYVVLAGRWYHAGSLNGPWQYQASDKLPPAFAEIPAGSDQADSRVHVAGTEEAREAVLDAQVPKTAAVARGEVDIEVDYDGQPAFDKVDGTDMQYAKNTGSVVIESNGLYYLVEDGVWYVSAYPDGPWQVADYRPQQVASIMPSSPVYNVKYVYVYDSTPSVVYVGYTPGYLGSYVYHDTIFYGSGWYYRPWISPYYYYPRFSTWGWNVSYNSWSGWSFGLSWGWGPFYSNWYSGGYWHYNHHWYGGYHGWWGPRGYRPRHYARNGHGYRGRGYEGHGHDRYGRGYRDDGRYADGRGRDDRQRDGRGYGDGRRGDDLYRDDRQRARIADTRDVRRPNPARDRGWDDSRRMAWDEPGAASGNKSAGKGRQGNRVEPVRVSELGDKARDRDRKAAGKNPSSRSRTEPVRVSDLSARANALDRNVSAITDSNRSRTEPVRATDQRRQADARDIAAGDRGKGGSSGRERTEPVRAPDLRQKAISRDDARKGRSDRLLADSRSAGVRQDSGRTTAAPPRQARNDTSPIPLPQYRNRENSGRQGSSAVRPAPDSRPVHGRQNRAPQSAPPAGRDTVPQQRSSGRVAPDRGGPRTDGQRSGSRPSGNPRQGSGRPRE
jgi:hypothetical protein